MGAEEEEEEIRPEAERMGEGQVLVGGLVALPIPGRPIAVAGEAAGWDTLTEKAVLVAPAS